NCQYIDDPGNNCTAGGACQTASCNGSKNCQYTDDPVTNCPVQYTCQVPVCTAAKACGAEVDHGRCDDGVDCTIDRCNPTHTNAHPTTGCLFDDSILADLNCTGFLPQ